MTRQVDNIFVEDGIVEVNTPNLLERAVAKAKLKATGSDPTRIDQTHEGEAAQAAIPNDLINFYGPRPNVDPDRVRTVIDRTPTNPWSAGAEDISDGHLIPRDRRKRPARKPVPYTEEVDGTLISL